ncbi:hypothetical protein ACI2K4_28565 [Micromonospora sp. NPDC050397]|uniref:hypothetical protein n=1 Tax=Micromonospora sp. NPDC050397 TaxID=3364279 RepID=UPI00384E780D
MLRPIANSAVAMAIGEATVNTIATVVSSPPVENHGALIARWTSPDGNPVRVPANGRKQLDLTIG